MCFRFPGVSLGLNYLQDVRVKVARFGSLKYPEFSGDAGALNQLSLADPGKLLLNSLAGKADVFGGDVGRRGIDHLFEARPHCLGLGPRDLTVFSLCRVSGFGSSVRYFYCCLE